MELKLSSKATFYLHPRINHPLSRAGELDYTLVIEDKGKTTSIRLNSGELKRLLEVLNTGSGGTNLIDRTTVIGEVKETGRVYDFADTEYTLTSQLFIQGEKPTAEVEIYIADAHVNLKDSENITNACGEFMEALGFEMETEDEPIFHSFWKKLKFIFSTQASTEEIDKLINKGKRALELRHVELPTAEQTEKLASAAAKIVESLEKFEEGVVRLGTLLVLKKKVNGEPKIVIQQLNQELIKILDEKPQLLKSLQTVYELVTGDTNASKGVLDSPPEVGVVGLPE